ncbi:ankyrin repeat domain-containing protein [Wolbachia endosymbiont of Spodoptera picta]|uniref:ankyrin repeat domain-containing protein n=1 Tax=Wolbachia endosymbiont of Spodoptera picta TaxID=2769078 RepID=UPI001BA4B511|nr:ankyrin repeat domain-containing protein [Wolbachia endosymbiont of Spodoptera picta]QUI60558.1 ankyrin repeat domain-containing protein [Wolbachia endosymbiont of Spodoptera picta]
MTVESFLIVPRIGFTANDIEKGSEVIDRLKLNVPVWGLPEIEGRIICIVYNVRLHFVEITLNGDKEVVITHHLIDKEGYQKDILNSEILSKKIYYTKDTIHIVNQGGLHFQPILRGTVQQTSLYYYKTMASEKKLDSESVYFRQNFEAEMKDVTDNQMDCEDYKESSPGVEVLPDESIMEATVDYEDRLSDEELQHERSQDSPRVTRASSISSSSTWYSALIDCRLTVEDIGLTDDEIVKRATFFVKTFVKEFEKKLFQYSEEVKSGSKIKKTGKILGLVDSTIKSAIPPGMRVIPDKAIEMIGYLSAEEHKKGAKSVSSTVMPLEGSTREILVDASLEIFQKFEGQFTGIMDVSSLSWERGIEKLAIDAVSRVINYISANKEELSVDLITKGVVLGESKARTFAKQVLKKPAKLFKSEAFQSGYKVKDKQSGKIWITPELYTGVGIKKVNYDTTEYYQLRKHDNAEKYGYRLPFTWELEKWWEVDKKYRLVNLPKEEKYVHILNEKKKKELAGNILKEINGNDSTKRKDIEELYEKIKNFQTKKEESVRPFLFNLDHLPQFFVERGNMLKMLNEKLDIKKQEEMPRMILIHGGYGVGKSELAKSYAHSIKSKGNVIWINAKSCSTLSNSFYSLAKKLGISTGGYKGIQKINSDMEGKEQVDYNDVQKKRIESIVDNVYEKLQDVESYFIFDNASQYEEIKKFLPPYGFIFGGKQPYILITSRNKDWKEEIEKINLDKGFSSAEALMFIEKALGIEDNSHLQIYEMVKLVKGLSYFPLALKEATKYIREEGISISQYLERYSKVMQESNLDCLEEQDISPELFTTLKVNFDKIKEEKDIGQQSHDILASMAYLSPDQIDTTEIFLHKKSENDQQKVLDALNLLDKFSVIDLEESIARVHMGVQKTIRLEKEQAGTEEEILREIMTSFCLTNANHAISVWSHASKYDRLVNEFIDSLYDGSTILHLLAKDGNEKVIKRILKKVDSNKLSKIVNAVDKMKFTSLDCAAMHGHLKIVKCFIEKGSDLDGDNRDLTSLHWAAVCGQLEVVKHFIDNKYWEVDKLSGEGGTPLHYAVISGNIDIIKYLIEKWANVNLQDESSGPLHFAIEENRLDIVEYLVEEGADVNLHDKNDMSPLHYAVISGNIDIVKCLVEKSANVNSHDRNGITPLYFATQNSRLDIVIYLVEKGANVNLQDKDYMSPFCHAAESVRLNIAKYLIEKKMFIISVNPYHKNDMSSECYATVCNHLDNIKRLITQRTMVDPRNKGSMSLLHFAAVRGYLNVIDYLVGEEANVNAQDKDGMSPLHFAVIYGHSGIIDYLVGKGANVNLQNKKGVSPLHLAVIYAHLGSVKYLIGKGADINLQDEGGMSPLFYALTITIKRLDIARDLIEYSSLLTQRINVKSKLRDCLHKRQQRRSAHLNESKKRKLENISVTFEENASNIQLLQGSQNLPSDISMQFEGLADRTESIVNINSEIPAYSFNSVAVESVNNKNLKGS